MSLSLKHSLTMVLAPLLHGLTLGMAHEGLDNFHIALDNYLRAHDYIQRYTPTTKYYSIQHWISVILYRLCMLSLRLHDPLQAIQNFRRYKRFADNNFGNQFGFRERLTVYYWYWRTLSDVIRDKLGSRPVNHEMNGDAYPLFLRSF